MERSEGQSRTKAPLPDGDEGRLLNESEFLIQLGERVREMRVLHSMSRRELAHRSGISERYVAQIEAGKGNVSIVRLLRLSLVFRCA
jgi:DNA-binding XRE family transcriptional regulator